MTRKILPILQAVLLCVVAGCATTDDLRRVRGELERQILVTNDKIESVEKGIPPLKGEIEGLRTEIGKTNEAFGPLRASQADLRVELTEIRDQIRQIRGSADELRKEIAASSARVNKREEDEKALRDKLETLNFKIQFIENFLEIGKKEETAAPAGDKGVKQPPPPAAKEAPVRGKTDKEALYSASYELFKQGKYDKAREAFENFLKQYPDTEFSDNAQFWIAECHYFDRNYEKAIVEYDKVVKNFPEGNKVPYALLKQGLSFLRLDDRASAKLLLQQVIKDFPNTSQARIARAKLLEIK
jgi:tol-pal system protein YbgF